MQDGVHLLSRPPAPACLPEHKTTVRTAPRILQGGTSHMTVCHHHRYTPTYPKQSAARLNPIQYRPALINGFLTRTGLPSSLEPA